VRAYEDLIRQGKVLYWGTSEWRAAQLLDAVRAAEAWHGYPPISNQPQYSLLRRGIEREVLPVCEREGIGQIVWSPLAQGVLTGKYAPGATPPGSRAAHPTASRFMGDFLAPDVLARVAKLRPLAEELGATSAQLALAWCLRRTCVSSVIVGATRPAQVAENAKASSVKLTPQALAQLEALFPL
jgi:aryl-alcohol dehydrogenase-like predicted oxidoreductase